MNWTTEFPTKPGYYWMRKYQLNHDPCVWEIPDLVKVHDRSEFSSQRFAFSFYGGDVDFQFTALTSAEWYGPIEPPE